MEALLNSKIVIKYALIHMTELALIAVALFVLGDLVGLPVWLSVTVLVLLAIKDIALFPKVWRSYGFDDNSPLRALIGAEATLVQSLDPVGYVRVRGELWKAEFRGGGHSARRGDRARVVDVKGMTLVVELIHPR